MKNNQLLETLKDLGLGDTEARVYVASLSLGPSTIQKIARAAGVKRTTAYDIVTDLRQKGWMNIEVAGFKKNYAAEDPRKLESALEAKRIRFNSLLPEFSALYNLHGGESFLKYYEGLEAVKGVYESIIRDIKPHEDYLAMSELDSWLAFDEKYFMDFASRRAKLPINIRIMLQDAAAARSWINRSKNYNSQIRLLPPETKLRTNLVVTPQRILIHQLTDPIIGIVIENQSVIQMHREMYEIIWKSLPE